MSLLFEPCLERINKGKMGGDGMVELFEELAATAASEDIPIMTLIVPYVDDNDELIEGKYVPELHLIVRKIDD